MLNFNRNKMKKNKIIKSIIPALTVLLGFSSCLKDENIQQDFSKLKPMVEIAAATVNVDGAPNSMPAEFVSGPGTVTLNVPIRYAHSTPSPGVEVTLAIDAATLTKYNTVKGTARTLLPATAYSIASLKATIPAGAQSVNLPIVFTPNNIDASGSFAIPLKITSASGTDISGNFGSIVLIVNVKNKYDGIYTLTGTLQDFVAPTITGLYPIKMQLITQDATSVALYDGFTAALNFTHPISSGGSTSQYGTFAPIFKFDASDNVIQVTNYYGQPGPGPNFRSARLDVGGINKFTTAGGVKKLQVTYWLVQNGVDRTKFVETYTYLEARK